MTTTNFDKIYERRGSGAIKWDNYDPDVIPLWVADTDFRSPEPIIRALRERVEHGFFGYQFDSKPVRETIVGRMKARYNWEISTESVFFLPNLVSALNFVSTAFSQPGDDVLMSTPAYPPFLSAPGNGGRTAITADLALTQQGSLIRYEMDFDAFEAAITPRTKVFLLCNPHNPVGRMWTRAELEKMAEICLRHDLIICADEIHCELIMDADKKHVPFATLSQEIAARTITLMSPSKTFNMPTVEFAFGVITNADLYKRLETATAGFLPHPGGLAFAAAQAAYTECEDWVAELLPYLRANRDFAVDYVQKHFPDVGITCPEATYLAWLDWRKASIGDKPFDFFLEKARVAFGDGAIFGKAGEGFVRLNLGTQRSVLAEALERVRAAVESSTAKS
jgi:cysteine-S-conjugate beta-lyase